MTRPTDSRRPLTRVVSDHVRGAVERSLGDAVARQAAAVEIEVTRPANAHHGDLASSVALKLARPLRRPPLQIADAIATTLRAGIEADSDGPLASVDVAPPGFLNLRLSPGYLAARVDDVRRDAELYGRLEADPAERINVEFVSANPTGPLHIGNARGAFFGDVLSRVLEAGGHGITREYYVNDAGSQVRKLGESVHAVRTAQPMPDDGYLGEYVRALADRVPEELWARATEHGGDPGSILGPWAAEQERFGIESSLARLGVRFDVWTTQTSLHRERWVERAIERLREAGYVYEQDGATWFRSTALGDDKDRVIIRSTGEPTYFAADIGYVAEKFSRGFDRLIYLWGENHHGAVARTRNAAAAMGFDRERVVMLLIGWVRFVRDGREIAMSKRSGEFITLDELLEEVGGDAARWFFAARGHQVGLDFDIELAKRQASENPVYYVQYAHARICSILRKAQAAGLDPAESVAGALSGDAVAFGLARELLRLPDVVDDAARTLETQGVTTYATELATTFHGFYRDRRVIDLDDRDTSRRRLALVDATRIALANALGLLGITAPESM